MAARLSVRSFLIPVLVLCVGATLLFSFRTSFTQRLSRAASSFTPSSGTTESGALQCRDPDSPPVHPLQHADLASIAVSEHTCKGPACCTLHVHADPLRLRGLYLGWLLEHNVGDDVLYDEFILLFLQSIIALRPRSAFRSAPRLHVTTSLQLSHDPDFFCPTNASDIHFTVLGGGSLLHPSYIDIFKQFDHPSAVPFLFATGFQESSPLPNSTINQLLRPDLFNNPPKTLSFPTWFNRHFEDSLRRLTNTSGGSLLGGVRGFLTQRLLHFYTGDVQLPVIFDGGLLLGTLFHSVCPSALQSQMPANFSIYQPFVIINFSGPDMTLSPGTVDSVRQFAAELSCDYQILIQSLASYEMPSTREFHASVVRTAPARCSHRIYLSPFHSDYLPIYSLYQLAYFSLNIKLHANIFAAAAKRPHIAIGARIKHLDFADSAHTMPLTLGYNGPITLHRLRLAARLIVTRYALFVDELDSAVDEARKRHRRQFSALIRRLEALHPAAVHALVEANHIEVKTTIFRSRRVLLDITVAP